MAAERRPLEKDSGQNCKGRDYDHQPGRAARAANDSKIFIRPSQQHESQSCQPDIPQGGRKSPDRLEYARSPDSQGAEGAHRAPKSPDQHESENNGCPPNRPRNLGREIPSSILDIKKAEIDH